MDMYLERLADPLIATLVRELPAVFVTGPRAVGKTTTARRYARSVVRLDGPEGDVFRSDPDAALRGLDEPVLIDEWQVVPEVLGAVKRALDDAPFRPGRFLITGSVRSAAGPATWPGTGRLVRVTMLGLTEREYQRKVGDSPFLDRLLAGSIAAPPDAPDLRGYVELALRPGFPEAALHIAPQSRPVWTESYVEQLVARDTAQIDASRDPGRLRRYLHACATSTAGSPEHKTLYESVGINRKTALAYDRALENMLVVEQVPAWHSNRLKRLVRSPKRYVVDPALAAALLGLDARGVLRDADVLGRLLDTFVTAQLRPEVALGSPRGQLYHLRQEQGRREIDLLVELADGHIIAVDVKAGQPRPDDARHLQWLRDELGDTFAAGVVFHTGRVVIPLDDSIIAAPIATLWS